MRKVEKNHVVLLSHIIYVIYNTSDLNEMRREVMNLLGHAIPFNNANFFLIGRREDGEEVLTDLINLNSLPNPASEIDSILERYMEEYSLLDALHWLYNAKRPMAYRTSDYLSEDEFENTVYYKEFYEPFNVHHGAQMVFASGGNCLGLLTLFRAKDQPNFTDTEIFFLDNIKDHMSARLRLENQKALASNGNCTDFMKKYELTRRECEILQLLFEGKENEEIAEELFISENTLRRHIYNMYTKIGIQHRWQLHYLK